MSDQILAPFHPQGDMVWVRGELVGQFYHATKDTARLMLTTVISEADKDLIATAVLKKYQINIKETVPPPPAIPEDRQL